MKNLAVILAFLLTAEWAFANEIDNLRTKEDVQKFVFKIDFRLGGANMFESVGEEDASAYGKGKFFKLDLDNNGLTDLVINGKYLFAITDNGNGKYEPHFIDRGTFMLDKYALKGIVNQGRVPLLLVQRRSEEDPEEGDASRVDTLAMQFGELYEYNAKPGDYQVEEIAFSTSGCYGTCPVFGLVIKSDRGASYDAIENNDKKGKFKAILDEAAFDSILETINYLKITSLQDSYSVRWTDDQTSTLVIKFSDGQVKKIADYGMIGTFGLEHLYGQLFDLRKTQQWESH